MASKGRGQSFLSWIAYAALLFVMAGLCVTVPLIGYPVALVFSVWRLLGRKSTWQTSNADESLDTERLPDDFHHHHH